MSVVPFLFGAMAAWAGKRSKLLQLFLGTSLFLFFLIILVPYMKFAKYLKDTRTPEWKNAYIDYRGIKKLISAISKAQGVGTKHPDSDDSDDDGDHGIENADRHRRARSPDPGARRSSYGSIGLSRPAAVSGFSSEQWSQNPPELSEVILPLPNESEEAVATRSQTLATSSTLAANSQAGTENRTSLRQNMDNTGVPMRQGHHSPAATAHQHGLPRLSSVAQNSANYFLNAIRRAHTEKYPTSSASSGKDVPLPLMHILPNLTPLELDVVYKLDQELDKVEKFYSAREKEAKNRSRALKEQLQELQDHRKQYEALKASEAAWAPLLGPLNNLPEVRIPRSLRVRSINRSRLKLAQSSDVTPEEPASRASSLFVDRHGDQLDPDEYRYAKKKLKKAILEHYRYLELVQNYRVLNVTGFRKALKKFEKIAKVNIQRAYMQEKVETSAFSSGELIERLIGETENLYSESFEHGNIKSARTRLRAITKTDNHHFSTFRTGIYLGVAVPVLFKGAAKLFNEDVREALPQWQGLLYVYSTLLIPVLFPLLVGNNIWTWSRNRINYQFIFELDIRTQLDSRQYFELPAFFLSTLIYAFWLSFTLTGDDRPIAPTTWPLAWLVMTLTILLNPLPIMFKSSRYWLIRKTGKLLISGTKTVEFADFWLGDQFCSLTFSLANLYFFACAYATNWPEDVWTKCSTSIHWPVPFILGSLPLIVRAVQSVKRYSDSGLYIHLINGGKYFLSILYYLFYNYWRHRNMAKDYSLVLLCIFGVISSTYSCSWDLLMDWSLFKRPAQRPFLRKTLFYHNHYYVYYVAIIVNIVIRFIWIIYVIDSPVSIQTRSFVAAMLEMIRRWQWNFLRLENEHIGNTDQYRATREVPLPYRLDEAEREDESEDEADEDHSEGSIKRIATFLSHSFQMLGRRDSKWRAEQERIQKEKRAAELGDVVSDADAAKSRLRFFFWSIYWNRWMPSGRS